MLWKHFLYMLLLLRTDWMFYHWHLFTHDRIYEFVKFLEEQKYHMLFLQDPLWCSAVNRCTSLFFQLYWRSFLLLWVTITILHTQRISLLATACSWKHVLQMRNPFSRKASLRMSLEDRPHYQGWRKAFLFHFPENLVKRHLKLSYEKELPL